MGIIYMMGAQAMLAIMAACVKALKALPFMEIVFLRSLVGFFVVLAYMLIFKVSFQATRHFDLCMRGIIGFVALACYYFSITHLALSTATLLANIAPIIVLVLAGIFYKQRISWQLLLLIMSSLLGVFLLIQPEFGVNTQGYSIGLLAAFLIALAFIYIQKLKHENSFVVVLYFVSISTIASVPWILMEWIMPNLYQWTLIGVIGVSTFFGQLWLTRAFRYGSLSLISAIAYSGPLFCWLLGVFVFDEIMTSRALVGAAIILLSGIILTLIKKDSAH